MPWQHSDILFTFFILLSTVILTCRQVKEGKTKAGSLRRSQQTEKKKSAQMLEEARKREEEVSDDISQLKV